MDYIIYKMLQVLLDIYLQWNFFFPIKGSIEKAEGEKLNWKSSDSFSVFHNICKNRVQKIVFSFIFL